MYVGATRKRKGTKQTGDDDGDTHDEGSPSVATLGRQPDPPKAGEPRRLAHRDWHKEERGTRGTTQPTGRTA